MIIDPDTSNFGRNWKIFSIKEYASKLIYDKLMDDNPVMVARLGSTEALCLTNYLGVKYPQKFKNVKSYLKKQTPPWWWEPATIDQVQKWSGFFPGDISKVEQFCELMLADLSNIDILGSWLKEESFFKDQLTGAKRVMLEDLEPFFVEKPWTAALANKKILVIHPFEETIQHQFLIKDKLFENNLLPDFELSTVKAVQTIAGEKSKFKDWFEALDHMKEQITAKDYDICILGCGAYGLPLASFVKSLGKKAIHLGGVTQLLFGIKGSRWENYIVYPYTNLYNEYWVRPGNEEKPKNAEIVEGAAYW
jgi:hypothetical protein